VYRGWWIVAVAFFSQFASSGASGWVFGVLLIPMEDDLGGGRSGIVGVLLVARLTGGMAGAVMGPYIDKHGTRILTTLSAAVAGTSLLALALVQATWQPYVIWAIFGLTFPGLSSVAPIAAISSWFVRGRTRAIVTYTFGGATAGLVLAPTMAVVADEFGWRSVWVVMGVMHLMITPLAWAAIRRRPEDLGLNPDGLPGGIDEGAGPTGVASEERPQPESDGWTVRDALRSKSFWLLTAGFTLTMLPASSIFIHMTSYVQSKGYSLEEGAAAVSIYGFAAVAGRFVWGFIVGRTGLQKALVAWALLYGVSIVAYALPASIVAIYGSTILLGIAVAGSLQFRAQAYPDFFGRHIVGSLVGYSSAIGTLAAAVAPLMVAFAFDFTGSYVGVFFGFGLCCMVASIGFVFLTPRRAGKAGPASTSVAA
jgi:sugar phosphate permease